MLLRNGCLALPGRLFIAAAMAVCALASLAHGGLRLRRGENQINTVVVCALFLNYRAKRKKPEPPKAGYKQPSRSDKKPLRRRKKSRAYRHKKTRPKPGFINVEAFISP
ncbi:hypothetical protein [Idiomarina seosinensis]|uniref:Uncharacterized protein n=1 Tax=Idiomarina seosinensis TaxID=281739 RepID=A0A432ZDE4_9GAMM|nr:hypothetical protein [Idiomarina seosinensis]RUO75977.1 hypothetical protein CWI81_07580 [Idiomarina seosinensis]